jgi:protein SCO1/2
MRSLATAVLFSSLVATAHAGISYAQLDQVAIDAAPGARLSSTATFQDENGRLETLTEAFGGTPALLIFADYTCRNLCGPILAFAAAGIDASKLVPGRDFRLIVIGIDARDSIEQGRALVNAQIGTDTPLAKATTILTGTAETIEDVTQAAGYHFVYDPGRDQFAHPAAAYVLTKDGQIARVLSGLGLSGQDIRLALVEAGQGHVGSVLDRITLRCFGFDPTLGIYTPRIRAILSAAGAATVVLLALGITLLARARPRDAPP